MTNSNTSLTILSTTIRRDAEGRYSLSDCWKVSGKDKNNQPSKWFEAEKTQEFLRVLGGDPENRATPVSVVTNGPNEGRGYWADRKAVIHYATWISPDFYLTVISAFDALVTGQISNSAPKPKRIRKTAFDTAFTRCMKVVAHLPNVDENQKALMVARGAYSLSGINPLEIMGYTALPAATEDNYKTPTELGKQFGLTGRMVNQILQNKNLQIHTPGSSSGSDWTMTEKGLAYGKMFDSTRRGGNGSQQQLKWKPSVTEFLRPFAPTPARTA